LGGIAALGHDGDDGFTRIPHLAVGQRRPLGRTIAPHARRSLHRLHATAQILDRPARDDARLGQRRAHVDPRDPGVGVRAAEERDVQETWTVEVGHVARPAREEPVILEARDSSADQEHWRGRDAPSNTSPSGWALRTHAPSNTSPSGWALRTHAPSNTSPSGWALRTHAPWETSRRTRLRRQSRRSVAPRSNALTVRLPVRATAMYSTTPRASERDFGALVLDAPGLVVPAGQPAGLRRLDGHADAQTDAQSFLQRATQSLALGAGERRRWIDADQDVVEPADAPEDDLEFVDAGVAAHDLLDAPRVDDDPADLLHVVEAGQHAALERDQRTPARARPVGELDEIARAVAQERHRLAVKAGEDQLALVARLHRPVVFVEDFGIAVVLVDVGEPGARVALEAPAGDLREPGQVEGLGAERRLDLRLRRRDRRAWLARVPRDADLRLLREIDALLLRLLGQEQRVRRRATEHGDRIRAQSVDALIGSESAGGEDEAADVLRRVEPRPVADPRAVGERGHDHVRWPDPERPQRPRIGMVEAVPVVARVEKRERPSGRRRRHVDTQTVLERHGQQRTPQRMVGLILLQLVLRRERQAAQIVERANVGGLDSRGVELPTVERARLIGVLDLLVQPLL